MARTAAAIAACAFRLIEAFGTLERAGQVLEGRAQHGAAIAAFDLQHPADDPQMQHSWPGRVFAGIGGQSAHDQLSDFHSSGQNRNAVHLRTLMRKSLASRRA
ncbi:hypothetical protein [Streptomyces sp. NPDC059759]|uniref:hypothetical protein n=1 Tax=Streptomyces sp. NPDC059759 TaxID=3346936 RepID=UPI00365F5BF2